MTIAHDISNEAINPTSKSTSRTNASTASTSSSIPEWHLKSEPSKRGFWWLLWWLYGALRIYKLEWVPIPHYWGLVGVRTHENNRQLWDTSSSIMGVFVTTAIGGGVGKTTTTTWEAANYARHSDGTVLVIDTDSGAHGRAGRRLGIEVDTIDYDFNNAANMMLNHRWDPTNQQVRSWFPRHEETGLRVLTPKGPITSSKAQLKSIVSKLLPAVSLIYGDTTPGTKEAATQGVLDKATIVTAACLYGRAELVDDVNALRNHMEKRNHNTFDELVRKGRLFVTIGDVPRQLFNRRTQSELAEKLNVPYDQVVLLPRDKHIGQSRPVEWRKASRLFRYAISESCRIKAEAATDYTNNNPLPKPRTNGTPKDVKIINASKRLVNLTGGQDEAAAAVFQHG